MVRDQDIDASEALNRLIDQILGAVQAGEVAGDGYAVFRATLLDERFSGLLRTLIIEKNFGAGGHEGSHRRRADPTRAPGDQGDFAFKGKRKWHI